MHTNIFSPRRYKNLVQCAKKESQRLSKVYFLTGQEYTARYQWWDMDCLLLWLTVVILYIFTFINIWLQICICCTWEIHYVIYCHFNIRIMTGVFGKPHNNRSSSLFSKSRGTLPHTWKASWDTGWLLSVTPTPPLPQLQTWHLRLPFPSANKQKLLDSARKKS